MDEYQINLKQRRTRKEQYELAVKRGKHFKCVMKCVDTELLKRRRDMKLNSSYIKINAAEKIFPVEQYESFESYWMAVDQYKKQELAWSIEIEDRQRMDDEYESWLDRELGYSSD